MKFSLVSTVFNEIENLTNTIANIEAQTLLPNEVVIVDAGSTDGTWQELIKWKKNSKITIVIILEEGCNVAKGRNKAIEESTYDLIASTDFGCTHHPNWLASIIIPFKNNRKLDVVGGAFTVDFSSLTSIWQKADFIINNGHHFEMDDFYTVTSRSIAYKKEVWKKLDGYPEWLTLASDDSIFWRKIKSHGFVYKLIENEYVFWNRHLLLQAYKQEAYRYGLGDGESNLNKRNLISHIGESLCRFNLWIQLLLVIKLGIIFLFFLPLHLFGLRSYVRNSRNYLNLKGRYSVSVKELLASFILVEFVRYGYLKGYFSGYFFKSEERKKGAGKLKNEIGKLVDGFK